MRHCARERQTTGINLEEKLLILAQTETCSGLQPPEDAKLTIYSTHVHRTLYFIYKTFLISLKQQSPKSHLQVRQQNNRHTSLALKPEDTQVSTNTRTNYCCVQITNLQ